MTTALAPQLQPASNLASAGSLPTGHIPAIDGLRGIAVLLVVIAHTILMRPNCWLDEQVAAILGAGWCGVDLFFVLSGFLITGILYDAKGGSHYFSSFYMRRTLRIFPVYYAAIFLLLVVLPRISLPQADAYREIAQHQSWFWLHLSNLHFAQNGFTGDATDVFWSLAIEEQFYLLWPLVIWFATRRTLITLCIALVAAAFFVRLGMWQLGVKPVAIYVLPFARMDGLAAGGLIAILARTTHGLTAYTMLARRLALACVLSLAILALFTGGLPIWGKATQLFGYSLFVGLFACILILVLTGHASSRLRHCVDRPLFRTFGRYSYAIYVGHLPVRMLLRAVGFDIHQFPPVLGSNLFAQLVFTLTVIVISLLAAILSWHLFEKHILKLKRFFPYESGKQSRPSKADANQPAGWLPEQPVAS